LIGDVTALSGSCPEPFIALLVQVRQDPAIWRLACRWAGCPELARDGLQDAFIQVATFHDRDRIVNVRAYFCSVLYNEIIRQRRQVAAVTRLDPQELADVYQGAGSRASGDLLLVEDLAEWHARCQHWLSRFVSSRTELLATVPGSSADPARYRQLVMTIAENVLREAPYGCMSPPELTATLRAGYPEWFESARLAAGTRHQRLSRARRDITRVLAAIVGTQLPP
jgi:Sigma-70 region 2